MTKKKFNCFLLGKLTTVSKKNEGLCFEEFSGFDFRVLGQGFTVFCGYGFLVRILLVFM